MKRLRVFHALLVVLLGWLVMGFASAAPQILHAHLPPAAALQARLARLPNTQRLNLAIALPLRNQQALTALLRQLSDPASPNYRHYLTPAQFAERFGPTQKDYQAVIAFANASGLKVTGVHANRVLVDVEADVPTVEKAFHVKMWNYRHPSTNRSFYAPDAEPTADLSVPILGISGLENYALPQPRFRYGNVRAKAYSASPNTGTAPNGGYMGSDFRNAYAPNVAQTGTGQTVGLLQFDGYSASDITYYETKAGLPNVPLTNVLLDGFNGTGSGGNGQVEVSLDIEMAISMAPGLSGIIVYEAGPSGNWHDVLNRMATDNLAKQLSCSWYIPNGAADATADQIFQEMAAQGQSFFTASGDSDAFTGLIPFPGDSPYITVVGGTMLTTSGAGGSYASEAVWNRNNGVGTGGGISTQYAIPSWQQGISMTSNLGSTTMRNVPDVALTAESVYVRAVGGDYNVGGTSCAAPLFAGFTALANQLAMANSGTTVGFINPTVYAAGRGANYGLVFHDTTSGNNFSTSSPAKFPGTTGYDLCTGWGTPTGSAMISALAGSLAPLITNTSPLPAGFVGTAYSLALTATGGTPGYTWSLASGNLPAGLSLGSDGVISGTPAATGTSSFTVQVLDSKGSSSAALLSLTVYPQGSPVITTPSPLPSGTVGAGYNLALQASSGTTPYTWTLASGSLPPGLSLASSGVINGTPAATGTSNFVIEVTGNDGLFSTMSFSLTINPAPTPPTITTSNPLPAAFVSTAYNQALSASGGTKPYTWSLVGGSLPPGLGLASTGTLSGTPLATGTYAFTAQVTGGDGLSSTAALSLTVYPQGTLQNGSFETGDFTGWVTSDIPSSFVSMAVRGNGYSPGYSLFSSAATDGIYSATCGFDGGGPGTIQIAQDVAVNATTPELVFDYRAGWDMIDYPGSTQARTFSVVIEPAGGGTPLSSAVQLTAQPHTKTLDTGPLSSIVDLTPYAGTTVRVCFQIYVPEYFTGPGFFELDNVRFQPITPPTITTASPLPAGNVGTAYSQVFAASGGKTPYTWLVISGSPPPGLVLSGTGTLSGTPTATGTANFTVEVLAANGLTGTKAFTLTVAPPAPVITSPLIATATQGVPFSYQITATNGPTSFGTTPLPAGLGFNSSTGLISGTPTAAGTTNVTISATNTGGTGSALLTINVDQVPAITNGPPPAAVLGTAYSFAYTTSGFPSPAFSVTSGALPPGLSLSAGGVVSGTPTTTGIYSGTVTASNGVGTAATQNFSIQVGQAPAFTNGPPPGATIYTAYSFTYTASGFPAPGFAVGSGAFPPGLVLASSGVLSGTPTSSGTYTGAVTASNGVGLSATQNFSMVVANVPPAAPVPNPEPAQTLGTSNTVTWSAVTGALQYDVQASTDPTFSNVIDTGWVTGTSYTFNNLALETTYYYRVRARSSTTPDAIWSQSSSSDFSADTFSNTVIATGTMVVADYTNNTVRVVTPAGVVTTLAGSAGSSGSSDGTGAAARFNAPAGAAIDVSGNVYVGDSNSNTIRKIAPGGVVTTLAGAAGVVGSTDGPGSVARFHTTWGMVLDATGNLFVCDRDNYTIRKVTPAGVVSTFAGSAGARGSTDGTGTAARFGWPTNIAIDNSGNFYVADQSNFIIRKITSAGVVTTLAGSPGLLGTTDGTGSGARFSNPSGITVDHNGNVFVTDNGSYTIRKITPAGVVTTFAGSPNSSGSADGTGTAARFYRPAGLCADASDNLFLADNFNHTIRRITPSAVVTTLAGRAGAPGSADGTGNAAQFNGPQNVAITPTTGVVLASNGSAYVSTGTLVSTAVAPSPFLGWGYVNFSGNVNSSGTALTVDVITPSGVVLASNIASGTDLGTLGILNNGPFTPVELRANLATSNSANTPVLNNWSVSYYTNSLSGWSPAVSTRQTAGSAPVITNNLPPTAASGAPFSFTFSATGFPAPTFTLSSGTLPPGLTLSSSGVLSGTPTETGTFTGVVTASNGVGSNFDQAFSITVQAADENALNTPTLPPWALATLALLLVGLATRRGRQSPG